MTFKGLAAVIVVSLLSAACGRKDDRSYDDWIFKVVEVVCQRHDGFSSAHGTRGEEVVFCRDDTIVHINFSSNAIGTPLPESQSVDRGKNPIGIEFDFNEPPPRTVKMVPSPRPAHQCADTKAHFYFLDCSEIGHAKDMPAGAYCGWCVPDDSGVMKP